MSLFKNLILLLIFDSPFLSQIVWGFKSPEFLPSWMMCISSHSCLQWAWVKGWRHGVVHLCLQGVEQKFTVVIRGHCLNCTKWNFCIDTVLFTNIHRFTKIMCCMSFKSKKGSTWVWYVYALYQYHYVVFVLFIAEKQGNSLRVRMGQLRGNSPSPSTTNKANGTNQNAQKPTLVFKQNSRGHHSISSRSLRGGRSKNGGNCARAKNAPRGATLVQSVTLAGRNMMEVSQGGYVIGKTDLYRWWSDF